MNTEWGRQDLKHQNSIISISGLSGLISISGLCPKCWVNNDKVFILS